MFFDFALGNLRAVNPSREVASCHQRQGIGRGEFVASELPPGERIEWEIGIQGPNDEVAVVIGRRAVVIVLETVALGEADEVEPVPGPPLSVPRAGKQLVNDLLECLG